MNSWRLSHPRRPLLWLAVALGGTLLLALLLAQAVRADSHPARLTTLVLTLTETSVPVVLMQSDGMTDGFVDTETMYTATVYDAHNAPVDKITVAPESDDVWATTPSDADTNTVNGHQVNLGIGPTTIEIVVTSENEQTTRTYTVKVTRISASNASLIELRLVATGATLSPAFDSGTTAYTASVANEVTQATVEAMPTNSGGTATVIPAGLVELTTGPNIIRVVTTSVDDTQTMTYTVTVTRAKSDDATLSSLSLDGNGITGFLSDDTSYTHSVLNDDASITVAAMTTDMAAKNPVISPRDADGGTLGHQVNLAVGANTITVMVEAEDGSTETYTVTVTRAVALSSANLSSLMVAGASVTEFAANVTSYSVTVSDDAGAEVKQVTVMAQPVGDFTAAITPVDADAATEGHQVALRVGDNTITVTVTGADSTSQVYTVKVTRISASNAYLGTLTLSGVTLEPKFASGTTSYTASVDYDLVASTTDVEAMTTVAAMAVNANVTIENGKLLIIGESPVTLDTGENIIRVFVTSADGSQTKTYTVTVNRAKSDDARLQTLTVTDNSDDSSVPFGLGFAPASDTDPQATSYSADVDNDVSRVRVVAVSAHGDAKDPVIMPEDAVKDDGNDATTAGHQVNLLVGKNVITVTVEAEDGTMVDYTVTVTREMISDSNLSALSLSEGMLTPAFTDGQTTSYSATVEKFVDSITVTAEAVDGGADVVITPEDADADAEDHQVDLDLGDNEITVMVTSSDGSTVTTYTVDVFRKYGGAALSELSLSHGTLNPAFDPGTRAYTASVANDLEATTEGVVDLQITVSFEAADGMAAATNDTAEAMPGDLEGGMDGHQADLRAGENTITVTVTSSDGTSRADYTVNVFRVHAAAQLTKLSLGDDVSVSPALDAGTTYYMAEVDYDTTAVTVTTEASAGARVAVMPADADTEAEGHQVALAEGANTIMVDVTHGTGDAAVTTPYMVVVERPTAVIVEVEVEVPGETVTVRVPGPTSTKTVTETVIVEVPAAANVIGMTGAATATEVDGRVLITRHDGGASLVVDLGGFIRDADFGQTYQVVRRADGAIVRQWVSPNSPLVYQIPWAVVNSAFTVPVGVVGSIPLDDMAGTEGQLVRRFDGGDDRIFSYAMGQWRHVPDIPTFQALGLYWCDVTAADASFFDRISMGAPYPASSMAARMDYPSCSTG